MNWFEITLIDGNRKLTRLLVQLEHLLEFLCL